MEDYNIDDTIEAKIKKLKKMNKSLSKLKKMNKRNKSTTLLGLITFFLVASLIALSIILTVMGLQI